MDPPKRLKHSHDDRLSRRVAVARNVNSASFENKLGDRHAIGARRDQLRPRLSQVQPGLGQGFAGDLVDEHVRVPAHVGQHVGEVLFVAAQLRSDNRPPLTALADVAGQQRSAGEGAAVLPVADPRSDGMI